ncbi:hypothetical protein ACEVHS_002068, partial [Salmonella enterica]|nr:hypothetical protein [Salmonella enterica]
LSTLFSGRSENIKNYSLVMSLVLLATAPITEDYTDELNDFDVRRLEALRVQA